MAIPFVDLKAQYQSLRQEIDGAIAAVIQDAAFIGGRDNPYVRRFEDEFAEFLGVRHCIGCANGTDSIEILLKVMGIGPGDEVIVPANSWISTAEAVGNVGATPVFVDSHPDYYTIDPAGIEARLTSRTKAIIPVHLYGLPAEMDPIMDIARRHGLHVLEDCAQAHGASYQGRMVGTFGDAASFSFYPGKNLGAYGDAGCMISNRDDIAERARMLANHGQIKKHQHLVEGRNSRLDGVQAAILSAKLPHLRRWTELRIEHASDYSRRLNECGVTVPTTPGHSVHVYHLYVVLAPRREEMQSFLGKAGIATAVHYPVPLPLLPPYLKLGNRAEDFPAASGHMDRLLSLPMYPELREEEIDCVAAAVAQFLRAPS